MIKRPLIVILFLFVLAFIFRSKFIVENRGGIELNLRKICALPEELKETSGILFFKGLLWTFNDSGDQPQLYGFDTVNCEVKCRIELIGARNVDWEAIAQDEKFIYVGDIGNNVTTRERFQIYQIPKDSISFQKNQKLQHFETIEFRFGDEDLELMTDFDSEAMLIKNDSIVIYTKDWSEHMTTAIYIPGKNGTGIAKPFGEYDVDGLATSAVMSKKNELYILGYIDYVPFLEIIKTDILLISEPKATRYNFIAYEGMQTEAITEENGRYFISCEGSQYEQGLYEIIF